MMTNDPDHSLLETLRASGLSDTVEAIGETSLDQLIEEGVFRDLPIIGSVMALSRAGVAIRDHLFIKKVMRFLGPVARITPEERLAFLDGLSDGERKRANDSLLMCIDRLDSNDKAEWLGIACEAYMRGEISFRIFQYFANYLDRVFILVWEDYIAAIKPWSDGRKGGVPRIALDDALALEVVGFYERKTIAVRKSSQTEVKLDFEDIEFELELSDGGWLFTRVVLGLFAKDDDARYCLNVKLGRTQDN